jgi:F-type H+-transporting ATPase subunit gamma
MSRRRNLEQHRRSLAEIREIMNSMKNLAYMEARKLVRFLDAQHAVVQSIETVASDFIHFHAAVLPEVSDATAVFLLLGSERGFCGNFNHAMLRHMEAMSAQAPGDPKLVSVGRKLGNLLEGDVRLAAALDGASVLEEMAAVLMTIVRELTLLQQQHGLLSVIGNYHSAEGEIKAQQILPPFHHLLHQPSLFSCPPVLNQSPREFLLELTDHYLFASLYEILYASFMAENHHRVGHLEAAVRHLDEQSASLARQCNALRQEEIVEEIEVILLNAVDHTG